MPEPIELTWNDLGRAYLAREITLNEFKVRLVRLISQEMSTDEQDFELLAKALVDI